MGNTEARPPGRPPKETAEYRGGGAVSGRGGPESAPGGPRPGPVGRNLAPLVLRARTDAGEGRAGALTKDERAELRRLRPR